MLNQNHIKKTIVLQQDDSDCGVACMLSLIRYYGGENSLERLREMSGTTKQGTSMLGLQQAAHELGFDADGYESTIDQLIEHGKPVVIHILTEVGLEHYMVCYGMQNDQFLISDPGFGFVKYSREQLQDKWKTGRCLVLEPNENFVTAKSINAEKKAWLIKLVKDDYRLLAGSAFVGVFVAMLGMAMAVFSQKLIDDILPSEDTNRLIQGIAMLSFILLMKVFLDVVRQFLLIKQSRDFNNRIIGNFYGSLLHLPKPFFDTRKIGELVARLNDTSRIQRVISQLAGSVIIQVLIVVIGLIFLLAYNLKIGLIALGAIPIYMLLIYRFNRKILEAQKAVMMWFASSESHYINTMQGIDVIKNSNKQDTFSNINTTIYGTYQDKVFALGKLNIRIGMVTNIAGLTFMISILAIASYQVFNKQLELGELMAIFTISGMILPAITGLALIAIPLNEAKVAFNRMFEFVGIRAEKEEGEPLEVFEKIQVKELSFRFPGRRRLLHGINLEIKKGEMLALVGESGSGKSTIAQILQRFYQPEGGKITVNENFSLDQIKLSDWRNTIGVVPQNLKVFNGTLFDNIGMGDGTPEEIMAFCKENGLEKYFLQLPQGYFTVLGEEGINLSGGQEQLLALARILFAKPQFLILDEVTAAMDRHTEKFVLDLLKKIKETTAVLFISHRLHILRGNADRICVMDQGKVIAEGTHDELLTTENLYSDFWKSLDYA